MSTRISKVRAAGKSISRRGKAGKPASAAFMPRPAFAPAWSKEEATAAADDNFRLDHSTAVAERVAAISMSLSSEEMLTWGLPDDAFMETMELLDEAEAKLKARMEVVRVARMRHLWCAQYNANRRLRPDK